MTSLEFENKYVEPELKYIETSRFELRKEKEEYHKEQLEKEEEEADKFTSLVESIRDLGILQPVYIIEGHQGIYEVVDGGRRLRAARFLGLKKVPAMVYQGSNAETELRKRSLIANIHRKDLTNEEKGEGLAEYYRSGRVDPEHAISYLNTLRQRRQINIGRASAKTYSQNVTSTELGKQNPQEYAQFLDLHKRLGIPRMTQYQWLTSVIFVSEKVRKTEEYQSLPSADQKLFIREELRNNPSLQKELAVDLAGINKEIEKAKKTEKKDVVNFKVDSLKQKKEKKKRQYFPNTENKRKKKAQDPFAMYGNINGAISKLWTTLTGIKEMPFQVDDILVDHIKPTREYFNQYLSAIGKKERIQQYNWLVILEKVIDDRMKLIDAATTK